MSTRRPDARTEISTADLAWPRHDPSTRPTMRFDERSGVEAAPRDAERAVVDELVPRPHAAQR